MFKIRKKMAEVFFELAFICLPKFKDEDYLYNMIESLNVKYLKVQVRKEDGSHLNY